MLVPEGWDHKSQKMNLVIGACWCLEAGTTWEKGGLDVVLVDQRALTAVLVQTKGTRKCGDGSIFLSIYFLVFNKFESV